MSYHTYKKLLRLKFLIKNKIEKSISNLSFHSHATILRSLKKNNWSRSPLNLCYATDSSPVKFRRAAPYRGLPKVLKVPSKQIKQDNSGIPRNYLIKTLESGRHPSARALFIEQWIDLASGLATRFTPSSCTIAANGSPSFHRPSQAAIFPPEW